MPTVPYACFLGCSPFVRTYPADHIPTLQTCEGCGGPAKRQYGAAWCRFAAGASSAGPSLGLSRRCVVPGGAPGLQHR